MGCCKDEHEDMDMGGHHMHGHGHGGRKQMHVVRVHEGCGCGGHGHGGHGGFGFQRRFESREEKAAKLEMYLADLKAEVIAVEEKLADLRG